MNIIELNHGDYRAKINADRGANCFSLWNTKYNASILREADYSKELDNPFLYGVPILFPVNRISGGCFVFEGRQYRFPVNEPSTGCHCHGELHKTPFAVQEQKEDSALFVYEATKEKPYLEYPHAFRITIRYTLTECGLEQITEVTNLSEMNMPIFLGFHTTFNVPFLEGAWKEVQVVKAPVLEEIERGADYLPTGRILPNDEMTKRLKEGCFVSAFHNISRHYRCTAEAMTITDRETGLAIVYENCPELSYRLILNGGSDDFICLEPQTCIVDCANSPFEREDAGFTYVRPGGTKQYWSRIGLKQLSARIM